MGVRGRTDDLLELRERREREAATTAAISLILRNLEHSGQADTSIQAAELRHVLDFDFWRGDGCHDEGCIRRCPIDGITYICFREPNVRVRSSMMPPSQAPQNWKKLMEAQREGLVSAQGLLINLEGGQ